MYERISWEKTRTVQLTTCVILVSKKIRRCEGNKMN